MQNEPNAFDEECDDTDVMFLVDSMMRTVPSIYVCFNDGKVLDPDDILYFRISFTDGFDEVPNFLLEMDLNMKNHRWYDITEITVNNNKCRLTYYEGLENSGIIVDIDSKDQSDFEKIKDTKHRARIHATFSLPTVAIPKIENPLSKLEHDGTTAEVKGRTDGSGQDSG